MEEYKSNYTNVCKPSALGLVLIPGPWNITEATNLCQNFRGKMNVITSEQNNEELMTHLRKSDECKNFGKISRIIIFKKAFKNVAMLSKGRIMCKCFGSIGQFNAMRYTY